MTGMGMELCGIPMESDISFWASCRIHFTLDRSSFTWGDNMNEEQFHLCFHFPSMQKDGMVGIRKRKSCEKIAGLFDLGL